MGNHARALKIVNDRHGDSCIYGFHTFKLVGVLKTGILFFCDACGDFDTVETSELEAAQKAEEHENL